MLDVYTVAQMRDAEARAEKEYGVPLSVLMDNAGNRLAESAIEMLDGKRRVCILCGKGNNGGDGYVCAAVLMKWGFEVSVLGVSRENLIPGSLADDAASDFESAGGVIKPIKPNLTPTDLNCDLIIDALLGTGIFRLLSELYAHAVDTINSAGAPVLSCDLPSGVNADTGEIMGSAVRASRTLMLGLAKPVCRLSPGRECFGEQRLADIGFPNELIGQYAPIKNGHLNLWFPQWQGGGPDLSTYVGAETVREYYMKGLPLAEVKISTAEASGVRNNIFSYDEICRQLANAKELVKRESPATIFTIGGGCDADITAASYLNERVKGELTLIYFDSHGDLNTPESSGSKFFYGMPLRALLGDGDPAILDFIGLPFKPRQVITVGMRDLDKAEEEYIAARDIKGFSVEEAEKDREAVIEAVRANGFGNIYMHIDLDVLDPEEFPDVPVTADNGMKNDTLIELIKRLNEEFCVIGIGLYEYSATGNKNDKVIKEIVKTGVNL